MVELHDSAHFVAYIGQSTEHNSQWRNARWAGLVQELSPSPRHLGPPMATVFRPKS